MPKQIKLGFDKHITPLVTALEPLYDLNTGIGLKDANGAPIYTEVTGEIEEVRLSRAATPVYANAPANTGIAIIEQFSETSQVSSSLLGVPRSETQLSLFSDVSTYGLDGNIWEFFAFVGTGFQPQEWSRRQNKTYGPRYYTRIEEISNEQALAITAFPTPWTYPFGPNFDDIGIYEANLFNLYKSFITLGNILYDKYIGENQIEFAEDNFISQDYAFIDSVTNDVVYNINTQTAFNEIEKWTIAWMKLRDNKLVDSNSVKVIFPPGYNPTNTQPGYFAQASYYGQLESKKAYRYQPGRASIFTFGVRSSPDEGSADNIIEWGCANDTDEYMFQILGSQFNIIRRSAIPLPQSNLTNMNLTVDDQVLKPVLNPLRTSSYKEDTGDTSGADQLHELIIPRDKFNGDSLDGNGPSGYIISFAQVTMFKIEFSWYGAIGAKFFAYVPAGNGDARWVLIHTIIIENEIGKPCLKDPFFKFRYVMALRNTSNLTFPQYIYKYGASYYIDGGDEGTTTNHSYPSNIIPTTPLRSKSAIGISAKQSIKNFDGIDIKNRKDIIPKNLTVNSSKAARIDIIECEGCPGFGHHYAPSLRNGIKGVEGTIIISNTGIVEFVLNNPEQQLILPLGSFKKIIVDGIYSSYIYTSESGAIRIARRTGPRVNNNINKSANFTNVTSVLLANGTKVNIKNNPFTNARLTGYDDIIASTVPLTKKNIKVNFLNPYRSDGRHFAEFFIGVTNKVPAISINEGEDVLLFNGAELDIEELLYGEYAQYTASKDISGIDNGETEYRYGHAMQLDPRLATPAGNDTGSCSSVSITVSEQPFDVVYSTTNPTNSNSVGHFLIFDSSSISNVSGLLTGEMGKFVDGLYIASGVTFLSDGAISYLDVNNNTKYYIQISGTLINITKISIKFANLTSRFISKSRSFSYNLYPLYVVIGMRDSAYVNNITIDEYDEISKFSYTPTWIKSDSCNIEVINSGNLVERINQSTGLFESGGLSSQGEPSTNFVEEKRLDSALVDTQLRQPLRPGEIRSSFFVGDDETNEFDLSHVFGQDRYVITPGLLNAKAVFVIAKTLTDAGEIQINLTSKEQ